MGFSNRKSREPVSSQAYTSIKRRILDLTLEPGEGLSEARLAAEFGLSRTPVREALKRLENDGLVDVIPQQGTFVSPIRREFLIDAQFARAALECALVRSAARLRSAGDIARLTDNLEKQIKAVEAGNGALLFRLDEQLHETIAAAAGRPNLWALITDIKIYMDRARHLSLTADHYPRLIAQHKAIIDALEAKDPLRAEQAMADHLNFVVKHFDDFVEGHSNYTKERGRAFD